MTPSELAELDRLRAEHERERLLKQQAERQVHTHAAAMATLASQIAALEEKIEREKRK